LICDSGLRVHNKMHFYRLIPTFSEGEGGVQFVMPPGLKDSCKRKYKFFIFDY